MGTTYSIKYLGRSSQSEEVKTHIEQALLQFDLEMSNWNPDSWVSLFNSAHHSGAFEISKNVAEILALALDLNQKSRGAFDISISPLIDLWGFYRRKHESIPSQEMVDKVKADTGCQYLELDVEKLSLSKTNSKLQLNCSALAKGFGVDLMAKLLEEKFQRQNYMVEIGGEVRCKGKPLNRDGWKLGLRMPNAEQSGLFGIVEIKNQSLATSGDYQNFFEVNGKRYSHILNPQTGRPIEHKVCSVSIISTSCALADGLATACTVLGVEEGMKLIQHYPNTHALIIERLDNGQLKSTASPGFKYETQGEH